MMVYCGKGEGAKAEAIGTAGVNLLEQKPVRSITVNWPTKTGVNLYKNVTRDNWLLSQA